MGLRIFGFFGARQFFTFTASKRIRMFIMLYKVVLTFESVDEILQCNHTNESYRAVLSCDTASHTVQGASKQICVCR